jgi:predicted NACHT family NTPase
MYEQELSETPMPENLTLREKAVVDYLLKLRQSKDFADQLEYVNAELTERELLAFGITLARKNRKKPKVFQLFKRKTSP